MKEIVGNFISKIKYGSGKFTCPYCYAEHSVADCGLKCSYNVIGNTDKKCKFGIQKYDDNKGYDWIPAANKKKCLECKEAAQQLFCYDNADKEIPIEFLSIKSLPIALLGAKQSGKSNYIGVLVNEIREKMTSPFNCSLSMACSKESMEAYNEWYFRPLYKEGRTVRGTDAGEVPPLIFPLRFLDAKSRITNMAALTFYDTAGENLDRPEMMNIYNKYIVNAHGIILLLDPLQDPKIREDLKAKGFNSLPEENTSINTVLERIEDLIRKHENNLKGKIKTPLALVFTKIDVLEQYDILPKDSCLREESEHIERGVFIKSDFEDTNNHMKALIGNLLDKNKDLKIKIGQFEELAFFGVSALGCNPGSENIIGSGIRPRRVLDPLLWLLSKNKYIQTLAN